MATNSSRSGFQVLSEERPQVQRQLGELVKSINTTPYLQPLQRELIRLAVAVALGNTWALRGHLRLAYQAGATRDQLVDSIVLCLPGGGAPRCVEALGVLEEELSSLVGNP